MSWCAKIRRRSAIRRDLGSKPVLVAEPGEPPFLFVSGNTSFWSLLTLSQIFVAVHDASDFWDTMARAVWRALVAAISCGPDGGVR